MSVEFPKPVLLIVTGILILALIFLLLPSPQIAVSTSPFVPSPFPFEVPVSKTGFLRAPELAGISGVFNAPSDFSISAQKGKVVLVDFWTYSCINCLRTFPYLKDWHEKYARSGLVIVGVHTPEFDFEKNPENVQAAVLREGLPYPVVQDNDYKTWNAYQNHYWPHHFLIDADGFIRFDHIGEGGYQETELKIVELLKERDDRIQMNASRPNVLGTDFSRIRTPEIYFGSNFLRQPFGNEQVLVADTPIEFSMPERPLKENLAYLEGTWILRPGYAELLSETGQVALVFTAKDANLVAGASTTVWLNVSVDGKSLGLGTAGADAVAKKNRLFVPVKDQRLYRVVASVDYEKKELLIEAQKGFQLYTFTFG